MNVKLKQGEDQVVDLPIYKNNQPLNLTSAVEIRVKIKITKNGTSTYPQKYSKSVQTGYGVCKVKTGTGNENIVQVVIEREHSKNFVDGIISFYVVVQFSDVNFENDVRTEQYEILNAGTVSLSVFNEELL